MGVTPRLAARQPGPDVVRAVAMLGVVMMNYHGYLILRGGSRGDGWAGDLFDPWTGPLSTRFAATFVLTAGVGVTLMTRGARRDPARRCELRWRLVRRGLLLYGAGLLLDMVWDGTILPYYGAMFVIASGLFTLRIRQLVGIGMGAALAGWGVRWWRYERQLDGHDTSWLTDPGPRSPRGLLLDVLVNGTHPLLPWLAFLCAGIVLGRVLGTTWWRPVAVSIGLSAFVVASLIAWTAEGAGGQRWQVVLSNDPFERGIVYTASALGTALVAFALVTWLADAFTGAAAIDALRRAGQLSLTIYVGHALVFNLLVDWLEVIEPAGLGTALAFAVVYWLVATAAAIAYQRAYGRGPAERLYRRLAG